MENKPKIIKKIKVARAEDFWSPSDDNDYYDQEIDAAARALLEEASKKEPLPYTPFDPRWELTNIRRLPMVELEGPALSDKEKRRIRTERLVDFKENLIHQKEGIARVINELHEMAESSPGATAKGLLLKVQALAPEYRFTHEQVSLFKYAIRKYQEKHLAVEKYRAMYPNDVHLFEACFGKKPKGKIEIVKGPMTLFFRCFEIDDYVFASKFYKHGGDETKIKPEDFADANNSAGRALSTVKIKELAGAVTVENVGNNNPSLEWRKGAKKTEEIRDNKFQLYINAQKGDIDIEVKGIGVWKVKIVEHDEQGEPLRMQFLNMSEADAPPIFDVVRVEATEEMQENGNLVGVLKKVDDGKLQYNTLEYLKAENKIYGSINMDRAFIQIEDHSPLGTTVKYSVDEFVMVANEQQSEHVRIHEDQHQFNKLFQPLEAREDIWTMMRRVVEVSKTPEETVQKLIHGFVRLERRWIGFDSHARDEILAHYKGGKNIEEIYRNLTESKLYDYADQYKNVIATLPASIKEELQEEISAISYKEIEDGELAALGAEEIEIKESEIQPHIESVFKDEYKADLKVWLDSISMLERKGYSKDEIVALFYQEPVNSWSNLARRMKPKIN